MRPRWSTSNWSDVTSPRGRAPAKSGRAKLVIEYDGGPFAGWAEQPGRRTIAGEVRAALETVLRARVHLSVAGRTDRGVHALGQVVSYAGALPRLRSVNAVLPREISVLSAVEVPDDFSARHSALSRSYVYRMLARRSPSPFERGRALHWPHTLDFGVLQACAAALAGTHDFTAFTPTDTYHTHFDRRVLAASWEQNGDTLAFRIEADAFMRQMNRTLVGTMLEVAGGRRSLQDF
ncbi:MAG: tRNA pseudouridine synthase A, partial [Solirubrobacterales bacterium]|nr:tRNA pseudouridine synthase A [Solirubrobacterales bacterium]